MSVPSPARMLLFRSLGLAWLLTGHAFFVPGSILPYGGTAPIAIGAVDAATIATVVTLGCLAMLHPRTARLGAFVVALSILGLSALSEAYFANYRLFVACLLLVTVVAPPDDGERALRVQAVLVYAGAAIDKLFDPMFRDGRVVESLLRSVAEHGAPYSPGHPPGAGPAYAERLLGMSGDGFVLVGGLVLAIEIAIAIAYGTRWKRTLPLVALLHVGIALATGSTFGIFLHAAIATAAALTMRLTRGTELATLAFVVYASSPFERPLGIAVAALGLVFVATREANQSPIGPS